MGCIRASLRRPPRELLLALVLGLSLSACGAVAGSQSATTSTTESVSYLGGFAAGVKATDSVVGTPDPDVLCMSLSNDPNVQTAEGIIEGTPGFSQWLSGCEDGVRQEEGNINGGYIQAP